MYLDMEGLHMNLYHRIEGTQKFEAEGRTNNIFMTTVTSSINAHGKNHILGEIIELLL